MTCHDHNHPRVSRRILREIAILSKLEHENIAWEPRNSLLQPLEVAHGKKKDEEEHTPQKKANLNALSLEWFEIFGNNFVLSIQSRWNCQRWETIFLKSSTELHCSASKVQVYDIASSPGGLDILGLGWWPDVLCTPYCHGWITWSLGCAKQHPYVFLAHFWAQLSGGWCDLMLLLIFVGPGSMSSTWWWRFAILILRSYVERTLGCNLGFAQEWKFSHKMLLSIYLLFTVTVQDVTLTPLHINTLLYNLLVGLKYLHSVWTLDKWLAGIAAAGHHPPALIEESKLRLVSIIVTWSQPIALSTRSYLHYITRYPS